MWRWKMDDLGIILGLICVENSTKVDHFSKYAILAHFSLKLRLIYGYWAEIRGFSGLRTIPTVSTGKMSTRNLCP